MKKTIKLLAVTTAVFMCMALFAACDFFDGGGGGNTNSSVTGITLSNTALSMQVGDTQTLTATVTPDNVSNYTITWSSSNVNAVTVNNGVLIAVGSGSATITARINNNISATCAVTVSIDPSLIHTVAQPVSNSLQIAQPTQLINHTRTFTITEPNQEESFTYTAQTANGQPLTAGVFRIESSFAVAWHVRDSAGNALVWGTLTTSFSGTGSSHNITMTIGETYTIRIRRASTSGNCTINVYAPNGRTNITSYTEISDTLWFTRQEKAFIYTPSVTGLFRLTTSYGVSWHMRDDFNNGIIHGSLTRTSFSNMDTAQQIELQAGVTYTLWIQQSGTRTGNYTLTIHQPNATVDISGKQQVNDMMRFIGQINTYTFTPATTGSFTLTSTISVSWHMRDDFDNGIIRGTWPTSFLTARTTNTVNLIAGTKYTIRLMQSGQQFGNYTFEIR